MDYQNEEIEEIILDEEETTEMESDSIEEADTSATSAQQKQMKNVASKKGMAEEEEEEETSKVANASSNGKGSGKFAGLYKDGTGKGAVIPGPVDTGLPSGSSKGKLLASVKAKKGMREDIDVHMTAMFDGEDLTETFKTKASTIFEALSMSELKRFVLNLKKNTTIVSPQKLKKTKLLFQNSWILILHMWLKNGLRTTRLLLKKVSEPKLQKNSWKDFVICSLNTMSWFQMQKLILLIKWQKQQKNSRLALTKKSCVMFN